MKRFCFSILFAIALYGTSSHAFAQVEVDTTRVYTIEEVRIYGRTIEKEVIPVQTLAGKELQKLSVYSVADAMRYFSGVQIKDYGGIGGLKTVNIRSMGSQHVGVFYDGIELGNAQNGIVDLGRFSLENMESVSLYNGQKSAIFQPAKDFASAGSIYMTTRTPSFDGEKKYNIKADIKGGSFGTVNPTVLWEQQLSESLSSSFNAEYMYTTGKYKFSYKRKNGYDTAEVRQNGDVYALRIEQGLFRKINSGEWKIKAYFYNSERGYPGAAVREEPGKFKHQDRQWDSDFFLQSSLRKNFGQRYDMLLSAKYAYDYLHYQSDPRLDVTTMYVDNRYKQQEIYFSSANRVMLFDWWSASLSADLQWNALDADLIDFVYPQRCTGLAAAATALHFPRFKLQASVLGTFVHETAKTPNAAAGDKQKYTPTVAVSWQPWKKTDLNLRAFYKKIFRMPTLNDLYYTFIGNKNLNPEYTVQYNAGATYAKNFNSKWAKRMEIQVDAYYNEVTDKIIAMPTSNQFRWTMVNLGLVEIRGLDAALINAWQLGSHWTLNSRINYTYQKAQNFTNPESNYYGDQIPYIPVNSGSFILGGSYRSWDFNYSFIYTGERYNASANIPENYEKPWYTSDISISKTFLWKHNEIKLAAEVNNLFNQQYEVVQCYPMPGTNFYFTVSIKI
jgi:outer membrane cobalamin receptor